MTVTRALVLAVFLASVVGCGGGDPNKDFKPTPANAPKPEAATMNKGPDSKAPKPVD